MLACLKKKGIKRRISSASTITLSLFLQYTYTLLSHLKDKPQMQQLKRSLETLRLLCSTMTAAHTTTGLCQTDLHLPDLLNL